MLDLVDHRPGVVAGKEPAWILLCELTIVRRLEVDVGMLREQYPTKRRYAAGV
jgi:hypothetical protein